MTSKTLILLFMVFIISSNLNFASHPSCTVRTVENLKTALIGETSASAKYEAYAKKAKAEGYGKIALLFEAASKSEKIHANNHRAVLEQFGEKIAPINPTYVVKSTKENLEDAIAGESYEVSTMYPEFLKTSNESGVALASISFNYAYQTEQKHNALYKQALSKLMEKKENELPAKYFICSTCGNTYDSQSPKRCGISMTQSDRFIKIG